MKFLDSSINLFNGMLFYIELTCKNDDDFLASLVLDFLGATHFFQELINSFIDRLYQIALFGRFLYSFFVSFLFIIHPIQKVI
jgi:hypothetical protein